jgi:hypothetical protein
MEPIRLQFTIQAIKIIEKLLSFVISFVQKFGLPGEITDPLLKRFYQLNEIIKTGEPPKNSQTVIPPFLKK